MRIAGEHQKHKAVVCMTTFNRIDCARINQEIIKLNYARPLPIVHACSSELYRKHCEDLLVFQEPALLQQGALGLLQQSLAAAVQAYAPEYIIHLEGDTWIMDERIIYQMIQQMDRRRELMICTSVWDEDQLAFRYLKQPSAGLRLQLALAAGLRKLGCDYQLTCRDSLATQFFVIRATPRVLECFQTLEPIPGLDLEQALYRSFMSRFGPANILRQKVREPIHPFNRHVCEALALYSQHWPARGTANDERDPTHPRYISPAREGKRETLLRFPSVRRGAELQRLLNARDFDYYNPGACRT